jgi:hypothetical protein
MISDPAQARRLARAIASDIKLYNEDKLAGGQDLSAEIDEGRALYRARVDSALMQPYEQAILELGLRGTSRPSRRPPPPGPAQAPTPAPSLQNKHAFELRSTPDATPSMVPLLAIGVLLLSCVGAAAWWWLQRGR